MPGLTPPFVIAEIFVGILGAFYGGLLLTSLGWAGYAVGVVAGLLWAALVAGVSAHLVRSSSGEARARLAQSSVAAAILIVGLMTGEGFMYNWMMAAALGQPTASSQILSALMGPAVPFFIALNSVMELLLATLILMWNWNSGSWRRALVLTAVLVYLIMRVWTYLVFAEPRVGIAQHSLTAADIEWFRRTLAGDYRIFMDAVALICLTVASAIPVGASASFSKDAERA